ncbi:hypothetical protein Hanom_Chr11g00995141 [Helianthus anomalus]
MTRAGVQPPKLICELSAIYVPLVFPLLLFQDKFQNCTILLPNILETCHFSPKN